MFIFKVIPFLPSLLPTNQALPLQKVCGRDLEDHQVYQQNRQFLCPVLYMNEHKKRTMFDIVDLAGENEVSELFFVHPV